MKETSPGALPSTTKTPARAGRPQGPREMYRGLGEGASTEAKRLTAAILEVLAGARTPTEAAQVLALSLPRYYLLEARALQGMLVACEPRSLGPPPSSESALPALRRACEQLGAQSTPPQPAVAAGR